MSKQTPQKRVLFVRSFMSVLLVLLGVVSWVTINLHVPNFADAATSSTINFQARLMTGAGAIAGDGNYNVEFKLYNVSSGGTALWTEDYLNNASQGIHVVNGYLTANLGSITAFPGTINWDQDLWLTMTVRGTGSCAFGACTPTDAEMSPRLKLTSVPYAFRAGQLAQFNGSTSFTSTLGFQAPTGGNQIFQIQDQGAAGTYNVLTAPVGSDGYVKLQTATPGTAQTGNLNISGTGIFGTAVKTLSVDASSAGVLTIGNGTATSISIGNTTSNIGTTINGTALIKPTPGNNSSVALQVQNAAGTTVFDVGTVSTNLITNPSIEQAIGTEWVASGAGVTATRVTTQNYLGAASLQVVTNGGANDGVKQTLSTTLSASTQYFISWYDRLSAGTFTDDSALFSYDGTTTNAVACTNENTGTTVSGGWTRHYCKFTTGSAGTAPTAANAIFITQTTGATRTFFIDAVQLEATTNATPSAYRDGTITLSGPTTTQLTVQPTVNTTTAFQVTDTAGSNVFQVDTINQAVGIGTSAALSARLNVSVASGSAVAVRVNQVGTGDILDLLSNNVNVQSVAANGVVTFGRIASSGSVLPGVIQFADGTTDNFGSTLNTATLTASRTISLPNESGTICLQGSTNCGFAPTTGGSGYVQLQGTTPGTTQTGNFNISGTGILGTQLQAGQITITGVANQTQLTIKANASQTTGNPFIMLQTSGGTELARINADANANTSFGLNAGKVNGTGINNTAIGYNSLQVNSGNWFNTAIGAYTLQAHTSGDNNTAIGNNALYTDTGGSQNTGLGSYSLFSSTTGFGNTGVGYNSLQANTTGNYNSGLGYSADVGAATLQNATAVGAYSLVAQSNSLVLGCVSGLNGCSSSTKVGIGITAPLNTFSVSPVYYGTGTASQSLTTVTGVGTTWTSAMVGMQFVFADGATGTITAVGSATSLTLSTSQTVASQAYRIHTVGFQVNSSGDAYVQNTSTTAFNIQSANGTVLFSADTSSEGVTIKSGGTTALSIQNGIGQQIFGFNVTTKAFNIGQSLNATGSIGFYNSTNSFGTTLNATTPATASRTISLPDENGTICLQTSTSCGFAPTTGGSGYIINGTTSQNANFNVKAATSGSVAGTLQANAAGAGNILSLLNGAGTTVGSVSSTGTVLFQNSANTTNAFQVQNAAGNQILNVDTTNSRVELGKASTISGSLVFYSATGTGSIALNLSNGASAGNYNVTLPSISASDILCLQTLANCSGSGAATVGALDGGTANANGATISAGTLYLQSASSSFAGLVNTTTQTFAGNKTFNGSTTLNNTTLAAGTSITITGGITSSRPASPTEGMLYYDTTTKSLLVYANGKWQADRTTTTKIVAMGTATGCTGSSPVSSNNADAADFVSTSCTSSQTTINSAISALPSGGGTVYLMEGTYILDGSITLPNNITLMGAGQATILKLKDGINAAVTMIGRTGTTNITVASMKLDGNRTNNTSGNQIGIDAGSTGSSTTPGFTIKNMNIENFRNEAIYSLTGSHANILNNYIANNAGTQALYLNSTTYSVISGNTVRGNTGIGINVAASNTTITGNLIQSNTNDGLDIASNSNTVTGNTIDSNGADGIFNGGGTGVTITGNTVSNSTSAGIHLQSATQGTISGNAIASNASYGIFIGINASNNLVSGNKFYDNGGSGSVSSVYVFTGSSNNRIVNNDIVDTAGTAFAIRIDNNSNNTNYLSGNTFSGTGATTISDLMSNTIYVNQYDSNGNLINRTQGGAFAIGTSTAAGTLTLQGGLVSSQLSAPTLSATITNVGTTGTTTYRYQITALDGTGETTGSTIQQTTTGNATLSGTNYNTITWTALPGTYQYNIYRCTGAACTPLKLATVAGNATIYNDQAAGSPSGAVPSTNTTGGGTFAGALQAASGTFTSANSLTVGTASTNTGSIKFFNSGGAGSITLNSASPGASTFTLTLPAENGTLCSTGSVCSGYAPATGGTGYVQLQGSTPGTVQTGNFNISGTGIANTLTAFTFSSANNITLQAASGSDVTISPGAAGGGSGVLNLAVNAATLNIGNGSNNARTIAVGNTGGTQAQTVTLGNSGGTTSVTTIQGSGGINLTNNTTISSTAASSILFKIQDAVSNTVLNTDTAADSANLITNPSFESSGTAAWAAKAGASFSRSTAQHYTGVASMLVTTTATADDGVKYPLVLSANTFYNVSFDAYGSSAFSTMAFGYSSDGTTEATFVTTAQSVASGSWKHYYMNFTTPATVNAGAYLFIKQTDATSRSFYIDGVGVDALQYGGLAYSGGYSDNRISIGGSGSSVTNLGIGTTSPHGALEIDQKFGQTGLLLQGSGDTGLSAANLLQVINANGSTAISYSEPINRTIIQGGNAFFNTAALQVNTTVAGATALRATGTTSQTADIFQVTNTSGTVFSVGASGAILSKNSANSTTAFQVQNAAGTTVLGIDTTNMIINAKDINVGTADASRLFSDAFESGSFGLWTGGTSATGSSTVTLDTATVRNGQYSVKFNQSAGAGALTTTVPSVSTTYSVRGYAYVSSQGANDLQFFRVYPSSSATSYIALYRDQTTGNLSYRNGVTGGTSNVSSTNITTGAWHKVEMKVTLSATVGTVDLYLDNVNVLSQTSQNTGSTAVNTLRLGDPNAVTNVYYEDDIVMDTVLTGDAASLNVADSLHVAGTSTFGGNVLIQGTNANATAFLIQNASGSSLMAVDTSTSTLTFGNGGNTLTLTAGTFEPILAGNARHTKSIVLTPEYTGAVLDAASDTSCSSASTGTMTSGYDETNRMNYYQWTSTSGTAQCYDVVVQVPIPSDWSAWASSNPIAVQVKSSNATNGTYAIQIRNSGGADTTFCASGYCAPNTVTTSWSNVTSGSSLSGSNYSAGGYFAIKIRLSALSSANIQLGNITLNYLSKY